MVITISSAQMVPQVHNWTPVLHHCVLYPISDHPVAPLPQGRDVNFCHRLEALLSRWLPAWQDQDSLSPLLEAGIASARRSSDITRK